jgi:hypothetical protein
VLAPLLIGKGKEREDDTRARARVVEGARAAEARRHGDGVKPGGGDARCR